MSTRNGCLACLFDFDFTLADSSQGAFASLNHALGALGHAPASHEEICRVIGLDLEETYRRLGRGRAPERAQEFVDRYFEVCDGHILRTARFFPEVGSVLARLKGVGLRLGIVSSKHATLMNALLERDHLAGCFELVIGSREVSRLKPHPEPLLLALARLGLEPGQAVYVGDSLTDARAAQAAGVGFIAVLNGVTRSEEFAPFPCLGVVEDLNGLAGLLGLEE